MGITDEDYAKALEEKRKRQAEEFLKYYKKYKEEQMRTGVTVDDTNTITSVGTGTGTVHISHGGTTTTFTGNGTYTANPTTGTFTPVGLKVLTEENLNHDAMKAPLSALVDMWTMRWQGNWVNEGEFDEDDFWRLALVRLLGASKLEKHNLADQHRPVYRIIE